MKLGRISSSLSAAGVAGGAFRISPGGPDHLLHAEAVAVEVAGRRLLSGASFFVRPGDTVSLVGRNGAGKISLLEVLAGDSAAAGRVRRRGSIGYVRQELDGDTHFGGTALPRLLFTRLNSRHANICFGYLGSMVGALSS